jgi:exopolysaccharide biosynthesis polyprenyl glycosylphosphotransferase
MVKTRELSWTGAVAFNWNKFAGVLFDTLVVVGNGICVLLLFGSRINTGSWDPNARFALPSSNLRLYLGSMLLYAGLTILACAGAELYSPARALIRSRFHAVAKPVGIATAVFSIFMWCMDVSGLYWMMFATMAAFDLIGAVGWRRLHREMALSRAASGGGVRRALIVGSNRSGRDFASYLKSNPLLGYSVVGFLGHQRPSGAEVLGSIGQFSQIVRSEFIDDVFVAGNFDSELVTQLHDEAARYRVNMELVPSISQYAGEWRYLGDLPVKVLRCEPIPKVGLFFKRVLDIIGATVGLVLLSPIFLLVGILIHLDSPGPCLYRSWRVGKKGVNFRCIKFRTMFTNADAIKHELLSRNQRVGPTFKIDDDPRITKLGKYLRKYSVDEIPQLWNVLCGDMSLVGPRPHPVDDYERYELAHRARLTVTPGLTGLWQVSARSDPSFERNMALDLEYIQRWSFWRDLEILLNTIPAVIKGDGA